MFEDFNKKAVSYLTAGVIAFTAVALEGCATGGGFDAKNVKNRGEQEIKRSTYGVRRDAAREAARAVKCALGTVPEHQCQ